MKTVFYLLTKYWRKHIKSGLALLFSGTLMAAIILATLLSSLEKITRGYDRYYDMGGQL